MSLIFYKKKRNFAQTSEPVGKVKKSVPDFPVFVVHKHAATRLHYDFRLEIDGVLKSWAVPKGPSMNPRDKRLAVMVEDHPYGYKDFEGIIPPGNYGAGTVIIWDNGVYANAESADHGTNGKSLLAGLHKGHLKIFLNGNKLKGEFVLVKTRGKKGNEWLLIKKKDKYALNTDILMRDKSVVSNRTIEEVARGFKKSGASNNRSALRERRSRVDRKIRSSKKKFSKT